MFVIVTVDNQCLYSRRFVFVILRGETLCATSRQFTLKVSSFSVETKYKAEQSILVSILK